MGAMTSTGQALAADILDPTTQAAIAAGIMGEDTTGAVGMVVAMAAAVTAVAAITTNWQ
jgi:hypothetical protein